MQKSDAYANWREEMQEWTAFFRRLMEEAVSRKEQGAESLWNDENMLLATKAVLHQEYTAIQKKSVCSSHAGASYRLKELFAMTEFEVFTMMLFATVHLDSSLAERLRQFNGKEGVQLTPADSLHFYSLFAEVQGEEMELFLQPERERNLLFFASMEPKDTHFPAYARPLQLNPKLLLSLQGNHSMSEVLSVYARMEPPMPIYEEAEIYQEQVQQLDGLVGCAGEESAFLIHLKGAKGVGKHHILKKSLENTISLSFIWIIKAFAK